MYMKSTTICFILFIFLLFCLISPVWGEEDIRKSENFTEEQVKELLSKASPTQPAVIEKIMNGENTLSVSGSIPKLEGEAAYDWWLSIDSVAESIHNDKAFGNYLYANGGPIVGYGPMCDGYIQISIYDEMKGKITSQDIKEMTQIIEKYAESEGIKNIPIVMIYSDITGNYTGPRVLGGHIAATPNLGSGTFAFAVKQNNNTNAKGIITVAHLIDFNYNNTNRPVYVNTTSSGNLLGYATVTYDSIDAIYVPYSNVTNSIYVGNNATLRPVYAGVDSAYGSSLNRYGRTTGNTLGYLQGFEYDKVWDTGNTTITRTFDKVGYMNGTVAQGGDSGGPIYCGMNVTKNNTTTYQALVLGMTMGNSKLNGEQMSVFVPFREIQDNFNVTILTT